ncbi:MAG: response regulator [Alphaproteobacteria bacterium]|nr:response regulator [Alphaproteobacteria bacterium]
MNTQPRILAVEDDREIADLLGEFLTREQFEVKTVRSGVEFDPAFRMWTPDLVLLDLMLPGEDGLSICRRVRAISRVPIIIVTAKGEDVDRIIGLEIGADDYISKPFNPRELTARIKAVLRRTAHQGDTGPASVYTFADYVLDTARRSVKRRDGSPIELSDGEFDLLAAFLECPNRVLSREQLLTLTKGSSSELFDRSIDVQLLRLRRKIEPDPSNPQLIKTVRGTGYLLTVPVRLS